MSHELLHQQLEVVICLDPTDEVEKDEAQNPHKGTALLAFNGQGARLLSYSLGDVEDMIDLLHYLSDDEDVPEDLKTEFGQALRPFIQPAP
ncbi:MAG: hypothetical protein WA821_13340 [Anaerolineales bacterium]